MASAEDRLFQLIPRRPAEPTPVVGRRTAGTAKPANERLIVYEGVMLEFDGNAAPGSPQMADFEQVVRGAASRLEGEYARSLSAIADDLVHEGVPERPDLPDPDLTR